MIKEGSVKWVMKNLTQNRPIWILKIADIYSARFFEYLGLCSKKPQGISPLTH